LPSISRRRATYRCYGRARTLPAPGGPPRLPLIWRCMLGIP